MGTPTHLPHLGSRGPLEQPKISKPWSLSCLRPAPPLKPSAALGYKEVGGCKLHKQTHTYLLVSQRLREVPFFYKTHLCLLIHLDPQYPVLQEYIKDIT